MVGIGYGSGDAKMSAQLKPTGDGGARCIAWLGGEREKHWILNRDDLSRRGGSWVLMSRQSRCFVIRTTDGKTTTGMEASSGCWFEWAPSPPNDKLTP